MGNKLPLCLPPSLSLSLSLTHTHAHTHRGGGVLSIFFSFRDAELFDAAPAAPVEQHEAGVE